MSGTGATIRFDCASGFQSLVGEKALLNYGVRLQLGRTKNVNKNPVAEKAIEELECELRKTKTRGELISSTDLSRALRTLNLRIRQRGLAASEILFQRDQNEGVQLSISDEDLAGAQKTIRENNHVSTH